VLVEKRILIIALAAFFALILFSWGGDGRFQIIPSPTSYTIFLLDSRKGHVWEYFSGSNSFHKISVTPGLFDGALKAVRSLFEEEVEEVPKKEETARDRVRKILSDPSMQIHIEEYVREKMKENKQ
jgi:hypothetical protein